jgi:hypothetical protein
MNSILATILSNLNRFPSSTTMIRKLLQLSAVLIAFAGITSTARADNARKLDIKELGQCVVVDNGPVREEDLAGAPTRNVVEEEISAPQYIWNRNSRTWQKNPQYCKATSGKSKSQSRRS